MLERQFFRVQQKAICSSQRFTFGIEFVAKDHVAERFHMYTQLVRAPCEGMKPQTRCVLVPIQNPPAGLCWFAIFTVDTMTRFVVGVYG